VAQRSRYACRECAEALVIAYETAAGPRDLVPVACPSCDALVFVDVPVAVAQTMTYRVLSEQTVAQPCNGCGRRFEVVFFAEDHEPTSRVAVACPECGWVNHATVARSVLYDSMETRPYEARRVSTKKGRTA
jgi:hypothetical protein